MGFIQTSLVVVVVAVLAVVLTFPPLSQVVFHYYSNYHPVGRVNRLFSIMTPLPGVAVNTALEMGVFESLALQPKTAAELANEYKASARGMTTLLNYLTSLDILSLNNGVYSNLPLVTTHLIKSAGENFIGGFFQLSQSKNLAARALHFTEAVKSGKQVEDTSAETLNHEFWEEFARLTFEMSVQPAREMSKLLGPFMASKGQQQPVTVLDIASGSGVYGYTTASMYPQAQVTLMDQPVVIPETKKWQSKFPTINEKQITFLEGDAFTTKFETYDVILVSQFLHHFSYQKNLDWLKKMREHLNPGGIILISEMARESQEPSMWANPFGEQFNVMMLLWTNDGQSFTKDNLLSMLKEAGAKDVKSSKNFPMPNTYFLAQF